MNVSLNYQQLLSAYGSTINSAIVAAQHACTPPRRGEDKDAKPLIDELRDAYGHYVKRQLNEKALGVERVAQEIGTAFGALCTHLLATVARWNSYRDAGNKHINLQEVSATVAAEATAFGAQSFDAVSRIITEAMLAEAKLKREAELFADMAFRYAQQNEIPCCRKTGLFGGYSPLGVSVDAMSFKEVSYGISYWDGADAMGAPLSYLYTVAERHALERFAELAFGPKAKVKPDCSGVILS